MLYIYFISFCTENFHIRVDGLAQLGGELYFDIILVKSSRNYRWVRSRSIISFVLYLPVSTITLHFTVLFSSPYRNTVDLNSVNPLFREFVNFLLDLQEAAALVDWFIRQNFRAEYKAKILKTFAYTCWSTYASSGFGQLKILCSSFLVTGLAWQKATKTQRRAMDLKVSMLLRTKISTETDGVYICAITWVVRLFILKLSNLESARSKETMCLW